MVAGKEAQLSRSRGSLDELRRGSENGNEQWMSERCLESGGVGASEIGYEIVRSSG